MTGHTANLGIFVAYTAYRADRAPKIGETILGNSYTLGQRGKGSNQAVAAARAGGEAHFITRLGQVTFADLALKTWADAGVVPEISQHPDEYIGAAYISLSRKPPATPRSSCALASPGGLHRQMLTAGKM